MWIMYGSTQDTHVDYLASFFNFYNVHNKKVYDNVVIMSY